jgi:hypothetical protein
VLAISIATRSNAVDSNLDSQRIMLRCQVASIVAARGFVIDESYDPERGYKKGMHFDMWTLTFNPGAVGVKPALLKWNGSNRLLGFPPGRTKL